MAKFGQLVIDPVVMQSHVTCPVGIKASCLPYWYTSAFSLSSSCPPFFYRVRVFKKMVLNYQMLQKLAFSDNIERLPDSGCISPLWMGY